MEKTNSAHTNMKRIATALAIALALGMPAGVQAATSDTAYAAQCKLGVATTTVNAKSASTTKVKASTSAKKPISKVKIASIPTQIYTGKHICPLNGKIKDGNKTLVFGTDYIVYYYRNINPGTASAKICGIGNYQGNVTVTYRIAKSLGSASVSSLAAQTYTGRAITPKPTVKYAGKTLKLGTDYTLAYRNNVNAGTASIVITGKGSYTGTKTVTFTIKKSTPAPLSERRFAERIFDEYCGFRIDKGLPTPQWDETYYNYAMACAKACAQRHQLVHRLGIPANLQTKCSDILQYATWQMDPHDAVFKYWANSTGHRKMMQCNTVSRAAAAAYNDNGTWYMVIVYDFRGTNQSGN